jgi:acylglycerol lipase
MQGVGGLKIALRSWRPGGAPRAVMILVHGFNSHSGYFEWAAEQLVADGFAVYALDHRGRGKSEGERFYVEKFSDYLADVDKLVELAKSREPGLPVFMLGHSAGGVIASSYAVEHQAKLAGLICESFAFRLPVPDVVLSILKFLGGFLPHKGLFKLKNADFSRDPAAVARMNADPLIANESQPGSTAVALIDASRKLNTALAQIKLPVLIIHGTLDKATSPAGSEYFYKVAASPDKTLKLYDGHFHDLLLDVGKEGVMADIIAWLNARIK